MLLFQSTLPHGERRGCLALSIEYTNVSIHAPARGATLGDDVLIAWALGFQSTLPHGERRLVRGLSQQTH